MVKHVILWQLKDELSAEEKATVKAGIKEGLESLSGKIKAMPEDARNKMCKTLGKIVNEGDGGIICILL